MATQHLQDSTARLLTRLAKKYRWSRATTIDLALRFAVHWGDDFGRYVIGLTDDRERRTAANPRKAQ